jgi:hypothetical protein
LEKASRESEILAPILSCHKEFLQHNLRWKRVLGFL